MREPERRNQWLTAIVRNEAFRQGARARPEPITVAETYVGAEDAEVIATVERADLDEALKQLSGEERALLAMHYSEDLTQRAIAHKLGMPEGTVKIKLHRARRRLRHAYAPQ